MFVPRLDASVSIDSLNALLCATLVNGEGSGIITHLTSLQLPEPGAIAFVKRVSPRKFQQIAPQSFGALLIENGESSRYSHLRIPLLEVKDPQRAFLSLIPHFYSQEVAFPGVSTQAEIDPTAIIGDDVSIGAFSVIGAYVHIGKGTCIAPHVVIYPHVSIGAYVTIHSQVTIRERCTIGDSVILQPGAVVGADGFGYLPHPTQGLSLIPHLGVVELSSHVEIGANSCVDRATVGTTSIGVGTKLDNLVQVGHNNAIGSHSVLCGLSGVAGSCHIGDQVVIGGGAGIRDHVRITDKVRIGGHAGVISDLTTPGDYTGFPLMPAREWKREAQKIWEKGSQEKEEQTTNSDNYSKKPS
jgi:UDP-3-O-[3-hydroxymyristoyl] glucosamine N-acyltransferase